MFNTRHKKTRKRHRHEVSFSEGFEDSNDNGTPTHNSPRINSHTNVCSHQQHHRDDDKVSIPDEKETNRNLKALLWESDDNDNVKDGIGGGEDDFKELAQEQKRKKN